MNENSVQTTSMPNQIRRFAYIDSLRGLAIFLVIVYHTYQESMQVYSSKVGLIFSQGARGVQLFFLLSAFTLYYSQTKRSKQPHNTNTHFFIRRFFRVAPMYYLGIIYFIFQGSFGMSFWKGDVLNLSFANIASNVFFVNSFNPNWINSIVPGGWFISVEFLFYFSFPFVFKIVRSLKSAINLFLISIILSALLVVFFNFYGFNDGSLIWKEFLFYYLPNQLPVFALGIIAFHIIYHKDFEYKKCSKLLLALGIVSLIVFWKCVTLHHLLISVGFTGLLVAMAYGKFQWLNNRVLSFLGKISYSAYLVHFAVLFLLTEYGWNVIFSTQDFLLSFLNFILVFIITIFITSVLSSITYRLVEKPFIKMGRRFISAKS